MATFREPNNNPMSWTIQRGGKDPVTGVTYPDAPQGMVMIPHEVKALYDKRSFALLSTGSVLTTGYMRLAFKICDPNSKNGIMIDSAIFTSDQPIRVQAYANATATGGTNADFVQMCACNPLRPQDEPNLCSTSGVAGKYSMNPTVDVQYARKFWDFLVKDGPLTIYGGSISMRNGFGFYMPPDSGGFVVFQFQNLGSQTATISSMISLFMHRSSGIMGPLGEIYD